MEGERLSLSLGSEQEALPSVLVYCGAASDGFFPACGSLRKVVQNSLFTTLIVQFGHEVKNISCGMNKKSSGSFFFFFFPPKLQERPRVHHHSVKEKAPTAAPTSACLTYPHTELMHQGHQPCSVCSYQKGNGNWALSKSRVGSWLGAHLIQSRSTLG